MNRTPNTAPLDPIIPLCASFAEHGAPDQHDCRLEHCTFEGISLPLSIVSQLRAAKTQDAVNQILRNSQVSESGVLVHDVHYLTRGVPPAFNDGTGTYLTFAINYCTTFGKLAKSVRNELIDYLSANLSTATPGTLPIRDVWGAAVYSDENHGRKLVRLQVCSSVEVMETLIEGFTKGRVHKPKASGHNPYLLVSSVKSLRAHGLASSHTIARVAPATVMQPPVTTASSSTAQSQTDTAHRIVPGGVSAPPNTHQAIADANGEPATPMRSLMPASPAPEAASLHNKGESATSLESDHTSDAIMKAPSTAPNFKHATLAAATKPILPHSNLADPPTPITSPSNARSTTKPTSKSSGEKENQHVPMLPAPAPPSNLPVTATKRGPVEARRRALGIKIARKPKKTAT